MNIAFADQSRSGRPAGGGAYFFAKRSINADKQARHEADMKRRRITQSINESTAPPPVSKQRHRKADHDGSPNTDLSRDPAPTGHQPNNLETKPEAQSKFEAPLSALDHKTELKQQTLYSWVTAMASHSLAIAKASLVATLMRAEPGGFAKTDIAQFYRLLDALLLQCSVPNIQLCKEWLLKNLAPSVDKIKAFGKYLVALSASLSSTTEIWSTSQAKEPKVSCRRRQLHILYLLHDVLHHVKFHGTRLPDSANVLRTLEYYVPELVTIAATYDPSKYSQHLASLKALINIWDESNYFSSSVLAVVRGNVTNATNRTTVVTRDVELSETSIDTASTRTGGYRKDAPYIMPASHGDASVPFYDLPAGNLIPCILPNSMTPISPQMVKPLQFRAGPADEQMARAVEDFLQDIDVLYGSKLPGQDFDEMGLDQLGQRVKSDDPQRTTSASEGYYGWSKAFCEKMKWRSSGKQQTGSPPRHETSQYTRKRTGRSSSMSGRSISPSSATLRSRSRGNAVGYPHRRTSDSRSRSQSRKRQYRKSEVRRSHSPTEVSSSRSGSKSYSPPDEVERDNRFEDSAAPVLAQQPFAQVAPLPPVFLQQSFLKSGRLPVPPPPPPNYNGPWRNMGKIVQLMEYEDMDRLGETRLCAGPPLKKAASLAPRAHDGGN
ncbi:MAG: hypothetical protein Q9168_002822 [Polycauliona sp. 1 TL-2023]